MLTIHTQNPQHRLIKQVVEEITSGSVVVLPTDSGYSLCCQIGEKDCVDQIRRIRQLEKKHYFTLFCRDFSEVSNYAKVDNQAYRFLKSHTPAPVTFILAATREVPKRLLHPKRRTIGIRISQHAIIKAILEDLEEPLMSVSVEEFKEDWPLIDPQTLFEHYRGTVGMVVDGGTVRQEHTTVVDLMHDKPEILRQGIYEIVSL